MATRVGVHGLTHHGVLRLLVAVIAALVLVMTLGATPAAAAQSPTTAEELLSGMVTEEVEPGVFRVINDGVRDVDSTRRVSVGYDGSVWLFAQDGRGSRSRDKTERFLRLGTDETHQWPLAVFSEHAFEVAPDGTMWVIRSGDSEYQFASSEGRRSSDGEEWTAQTCPQGRFCRAFTVAPDGRVWASWREDHGRWRVGHLGPTGWQPLDGYARNKIGPFRGYTRLFVTDAGDIYGEEVDGLFRYYENGRWEGFSLGWHTLIGVGRDGTVWRGDDVGLARFADGEWAEWTSADLPDTRYSLDIAEQFEVAPDGSLWLSLLPRDGEPLENDWGGAEVEGHPVCDGLFRFDGESLDRFLPGACTSSMDIAPDGSVWLRSRGGNLYVITPEAVAATR